MTTAKALGGGLPVGACVTTPEAGEVLEPGDHGSTFAGGPLIAAGGARRPRYRRRPGAAARRCASWARRSASGLEALDGVGEVRGRGLMLGVGLEEGIDAAAVGADLLERGLIVNVPEPGTLRLLPPLTADPEQLEGGAPG